MMNPRFSSSQFRYPLMAELSVAVIGLSYSVYTRVENRNRALDVIEMAGGHWIYADGSETWLDRHFPRFSRGWRSVYELNLDLRRSATRLLKEIRPVPEVENVCLEFTPIGEKECEFLSCMPNLRVLHLYHSDVDDDCIDELSRLTGLKELYVDKTRLSNDGCERLRKLMPNTIIKN